MNGPASLLLPLGLIAALLVTAVLHAAPLPSGDGSADVFTPASLVTAAVGQSFRDAAAPMRPTPAKRAFLASTPSTLVVRTPVPASLPTRTPDTPTPTIPPQPTNTPVPAAREGCDPAYPDENTCIPPGPPFNQGCAITMERNFTVLPPDPQRLDHDKDGIGCEPL